MAKMNVIHILLSLATNFDQSLQEFDIKNAFLHWNLEEEVYMERKISLGIKFVNQTRLYMVSNNHLKPGLGDMLKQWKT